MRLNWLERLTYGDGLLLDDVPITAGIGTSIATELIGGRNIQLVKPTFGIAGAFTDVSGAAPFPIEPGLKLTEQCTRATFSFSTAADNQVIAADAANKIRIYGLLFTVDSPVSVKLGEGGPTYWTGAMRFGAGGGLFLSQQGEPHFMNSAINKSFLINLSAVVVCSGVVWYTSVAP